MELFHFTYSSESNNLWWLWLQSVTFLITIQKHFTSCVEFRLVVVCLFFHLSKTSQLIHPPSEQFVSNSGWLLYLFFHFAPVFIQSILAPPPTHFFQLLIVVLQSALFCLDAPPSNCSQINPQLQNIHWAIVILIKFNVLVNATNQTTINQCM